MKRQTLLGVLFLVIGVVVIAAALAPVLAHQPIALWPLIAGFVAAIFGAWLIPSSGAGPVVNQMIVTLGNSNLPFVGGGRRAGDQPSPPKDGAS